MLIEFDEMVADMKANKKISLVVAELFSRMRKLTFHLCLYHNLLSKCLLYHENSQQKRTSKNSVKSFI